MQTILHVLNAFSTHRLLSVHLIAIPLLPSCDSILILILQNFVSDTLSTGSKAGVFDSSLVTVLHFYLRGDLGTSAITGIIRFVLSWYWANVG
jgi:hypothetical protein